ncbi:MAG: sulfotransferase [Candidatus Omnitrophota bacterium]
MKDPKILCLITLSRSGSNLFHSLLDGHPQVLSFPRYLQFNGFWEGLKDKSDAAFCVDSFIAAHPKIFSGLAWIEYDRADRLGPGMDETFSVDEELFRREALKILGGGRLSRKGLFLALNCAYHSACGKSFPEEPLIVDHIHYIDRLDEVKAALADFPETTYALVMTRHPVDNLNACVGAMKWRDMLFCGELYNRHKQILRGILHFTEACPGLRVKYLGFERFLNEPREAMEAFASWVGIRWDDCLLRSTLQGKLWWGNGRVPRNGITGGRGRYEPKTILEKKDLEMFTGIIPARMSVMGYSEPVRAGAAPSRIKLCLLIALPTAAEWGILKNMFSPAYWKGVGRKGRGRIPLALKRLNPVAWGYYFIKRVLYYLGFMAGHDGGKEIAPMLMDYGKTFVRLT